MEPDRAFTAFDGTRCIASGPLREVLLALKARADAGARTTALVFDDRTGKEIDFDLRGTPEEALARAMPSAGPGRPKLGVVAREVTLLPRHWEWLEAQPNGASAALRRLVEEATKRDPGAQESRRAIDAAGRVMTALAGDLPGYEEASRALYARDAKKFEALVKAWPADVAKHLRRMIGAALRTGGPSR